MTFFASELEKFNHYADAWWDDSAGPHKLLHNLNPLRLDYIQQQIAACFPDRQNHQISILDLGCGGGLVSESLARQGYVVEGCDESGASIRVATDHAKSHNIDIHYFQGGVDDLRRHYDVIVSLEVVEHVDDVEYFMRSLLKHMRPQGLVVLSTINRTALSYCGAILWAEKIARLVPNHLHQWSQFVKPHEIIKKSGLELSNIRNLQGYIYNPITKSWQLTQTLAVNYFLTLGHFDNRASNLPSA